VLDGIPSIGGIESSRLVESGSPESSRTSMDMSIGVIVLEKEATSIAAKETDKIALISFFHITFLAFISRPITMLAP
jgi:hypothetical protein